jgi:3-carboxy-cis,cis-muconate cycloisomerase
MARVLGTTRGLIVAEAVMMGLAPRLGRQKAHDLVYDCCQRALRGEMGFADALLAEPAIAAVFTRTEIEALTDPGNYLGAAPEMTYALLAARERINPDGSA